MATLDESIQRSRDTLATAKLGLRDVLDGIPERRLGGLRNLVVFGRAVTNVLQGMRSTQAGFDAWYAPYVEQMRNDPLMRYFYILRSEILKEGKLDTSVRLHINSFRYPEDMMRLGAPPAGANAFFMGDQSGGSGWEITLPNGETEKFYIDIPGYIATIEIHLPEAPDTHLGFPIQEKRIEALAQLFFDYLENMVVDARRTFSRPGA